MNKILSQALKKAVSEYSPEVKELERNNKPDLFSLNSETELFQNDKGIIINSLRMQIIVSICTSYSRK